MILLNPNLKSFTRFISNKKVYIYGTGADFFHLMDRSVWKAIEPQVVFCVDQNRTEPIQIKSGREIPVYLPEALRKVDSGLVLIVSHNYAYEMFSFASRIIKSDKVGCVIMPLMWANSDGDDMASFSHMIGIGEEQIPRIIHSFWFSGEKMPELYQMCYQTWKELLPDYEIIIWDQHSYDVSKHSFMLQALEQKKWAYVSDYARLDVINEMGGVYLDLDVKLVRRIDPLLTLKSFFSFGQQLQIDLGSGFGSVKNNKLIKNMMTRYDGQSFLNKKGTPDYVKFVQPTFIKPELDAIGLNDVGDMQIIDDMVFLPRKYFSPMDTFTYESKFLCGDTYGIHMHNTSWREEDLRALRENNKRLEANAIPC